MIARLGEEYVAEKARMKAFWKDIDNLEHIKVTLPGLMRVSVVY